MKQRLCQYANCEVESTTVILTDTNNGTPAERPAFCGRMHAALWLLDREGHRELARKIEHDMTKPHIKRGKPVKIERFKICGGDD